MAEVAENLRTYLLATQAVKDLVGERVFYNHVSQDAKPPFLFVARSGVTHERHLGSSGAVPFSEIFAIEAVAADPLEAQKVAAAVRTLDGIRSTTFGDVTATMFLDEQDADYVKQQDDSDLGRHVEALSAEVYL